MNEASGLQEDKDEQAEVFEERYEFQEAAHCGILDPPQIGSLRLFLLCRKVCRDLN
jgi:hypothetical protein